MEGIGISLLGDRKVKGIDENMSQYIMHVVGNRPQLIKLAPISREIRKRGYQEIIVHSGQHFDENMSDVFFDELDIPRPNDNLGISGGSHSEMTARIMLALEPVMLRYTPSLVIIYGDTNSTLAASLVARKLNIPIVHVEAGLRTRADNPEEINRIIVDHTASLLCAPDKEALNNLKAENLGENSYFTGDVMYDTFLYNINKVDTDGILSKYGLQKNEYILMTWHRQENTSDAGRMGQILEMVEGIGKKIICPLHPRTRIKLEEYGLMSQVIKIEKLEIIEPIGYLEMMGLALNCGMILTDSGGLSKESFFVGVKCMFMLDVEVWHDLERISWIMHMCNDNQENINRINHYLESPRESCMQVGQFYGDGYAASKIVDLIEKILSIGE